MTEILLFFLLPLLLLLLLFLPILPKIAKYMSRTQVPEEDQRVSTVSDLKNYEPRPKAIIRTEGKNAPNDKLENLYWWDPDGEASNADGDEIIESNVSGYGNGEIDEGVWRRFVSPMSEARNQIDLKDTSSVTREAGYSLLNTRYTGKNFDWYAEGSNLSLVRDLIFNDDGTKMFAIGSTQDVIEEFSLSDPYDISTGSFTVGVNTVNDFDWSSYDGSGADPVSAEFVNGGSDLFLISQSATVKAVQKITLSTPYDLSSTTSADGGATLPTGLNSIEFHPNDGSTFFSSDAAGKVEEYSLDAGAFDLSGGVSKVNQLDISSEESGNRSFTFSGDGRAFFTSGSSSNKVHKFELGAAYDITSSVTLTETFDVSEITDFPEFVTFNADGSNFFLGHTSTGKYYEFESTVSRIDIRNTLSGGGGISFDSKSGEIATTTTDDITEGSDSLYYTSERSQDELKIRGSGLSYEKNTEKTGVFGSAVYTGKSLDVTSEDEEPKGLVFNNDGSKLFVIGDDKQTIYEYDLSTGFDLSTASYSGTSLKVTSELSNPRDITFNPNGTKMLAIGSGYSDVQEYNLTTGFDLSTASYSGTSFDVYSEETEPRGLAFNSDGKKMFIVGTSSDSVHEYNLNTGFDISTASYSGTSFDVSGEEVFPIVLEFNGDGTKMFTLGYQSDSILQYDLGSGFDISTASFSGESFGPVSGETEAGLAFNSNDTKAFVIEENVFQYNLESKATLALETSGGVGAVQRSSGSIDSGLVGNTSELYVNPDTGNVGIGTDSPDNNLHVNGNTTDVVKFAHNNSSTDSAHLNLLSGSDGTSRIALGSGTTTDQAIFDFDIGNRKARVGTNLGSGDLVFYSGSFDEKARITSSGNIGVGTDSPNQKLDVKGSLKLDSGGTTRVFYDTDKSGDKFYFQRESSSSETALTFTGTDVTIGSAANANNPLTVDGDADFTGNVGIGKANPVRKLDVQGGQMGINVDSEKAVNLNSITQDDPIAVNFKSGRTQSWAVGMGLNAGSGRSLEFREISGSGTTDTKSGMRLKRTPKLLLTKGSGGDQTSLQLDDPNNRSYLQYEGSTAITFNSAGNVGIDKINPSKTLDVAGQVTMDDTYIRNLLNVSSDTTTKGDDFYSVDTSGGSVTLTLSSSDAETGRVIHVKRNGNQRVAIDTEGSETIDGRSSAQLGSDEESVRLVYNGANSDWEIY